MPPRPYRILWSLEERWTWLFGWQIEGSKYTRNARVLKGPFALQRLWRKLDQEVRAA